MFVVVTAAGGVADSVLMEVADGNLYNKFIYKYENVGLSLCM